MVGLTEKKRAAGKAMPMAGLMAACSGTQTVVQRAMKTAGHWVAVKALLSVDLMVWMWVVEKVELLADLKAGWMVEW